jgi:hypothetical protein
MTPSNSDCGPHTDAVLSGGDAAGPQTGVEAAGGGCWRGVRAAAWQGNQADHLDVPWNCAPNVHTFDHPSVGLCKHGLGPNPSMVVNEAWRMKLDVDPPDRRDTKFNQGTPETSTQKKLRQKNYEEGRGG